MSQKITTIIANYNCSQFINGAIKSALEQTYPTNIVVIDDSSTDDSINVIYSSYFKSKPHEKDIFEGHSLYKTNDNKLSLIKLNQNVGPAEARNIGIRYSIEWSDAFAILDADDEMKKNKLEILNSYMMLDINNVGVVYADYDILNVVSKRSFREYKHAYSHDMLKHQCIVHSNSLISKAALLHVADSNGFYDRRIKGPEDYDLWLRIARKFMILHVPESLSVVRVTGNNISSPAHSEFNANFATGFDIINSKGTRR